MLHGDPTMKRYEIVYRKQSPKLDPCDKGWWADVPGDLIDEFPWYTGGDKQATTFRAAWCDDGLYLKYDCRDKHISAVATETNGYVWQDSCVEAFVAPSADKPLNYYNFEMNCVGTYLMGTHCDWGEGYMDRSIDIGIEVATTVPGPTKDESPDDDGWLLVARIPWKHFEKEAVNLPPKPGDLWRANLYRLGGKTDPQNACWSPIESPHASFHQPQFFGEIVFVDRS